MQSDCFVCASDERLVVDANSIPDFFSKVECCLSSKVEKDTAKKVCYKCIYEFEQCSRFIENSSPSKNKKNCCCLCQGKGKKGQIFEVKKEKNFIHGSLHKISNIFHNDFSDASDLLICLDCRYYLDVVYDLRIIYKSSRSAVLNGTKIEKKIPAEAVNRKTTTRQVRFELQTPSDTDSNSSEMAPTRKKKASSKSSQSAESSKIRKCDSCKCAVDQGVDMFRFHKSKKTVCKKCWMAEDGGKSSLKKRKRTEGSNLNCKIVLKDVLNKDLSGEEMPYKIEKDDKGNTVYIVTQESSESEDKPQKRDAKSTSKNKESQETSENEEKSSKIEEKPLKKNTKSPPKAKVPQSPNEEPAKSTRSLRHKKEVGSSDTEQKQAKVPEENLILDEEKSEKVTKSPKSRKVAAASKTKVAKKASPKSKNDSENTDVEEKRSRRMTRSSSKEPKPLVSDSKELSPRPKRAIRKKRQASETIELDEPKAKKTRTSVSEGAATSPKTRKKKTSTSSIISISDDETVAKVERFNCKCCDLEFETKVQCRKHELTHSKKELKVKLTRVRAVKTLSEIPESEEVDEDTSEIVDSSQVAASETVNIAKSRGKKNAKDSEDEDVDVEKDTDLEKKETDVDMEKSEKEVEKEKVPEDVEKMEESEVEEEKCEESKEQDEEEKVNDEGKKVEEVEKPDEESEKKTEEVGDNENEEEEDKNEEEEDKNEEEEDKNEGNDEVEDKNEESKVTEDENVETAAEEEKEIEKEQGEEGVEEKEDNAEESEPMGVDQLDETLKKDEMMVVDEVLETSLENDDKLKENTEAGTTVKETEDEASRTCLSNGNEENEAMETRLDTDEKSPLIEEDEMLENGTSNEQGMVSDSRKLFAVQQEMPEDFLVTGPVGADEVEDVFQSSEKTENFVDKSVEIESPLGGVEETLMEYSSAPDDDMPSLDPLLNTTVVQGNQDEVQSNDQ